MTTTGAIIGTGVAGVGIGKAVQKGINHLQVEISNTLVHAVPDKFSSYVQITPSGLLGPVLLMN